MLAFRRSLRIHEDPVVQTFIRRHVEHPQTFVSRIERDDEMFLFDLKVNKGDRRQTAIGYYTLGARISAAIRQIGTWHFGPLERLTSFLDFACGYGRSTRFLSRVIPPDRIWACDIYSKAVECQEWSYGVNGIVSVLDPARFPRDRRFDYIFASSFFTHMPQETFGAWMRTLYEMLTPQGILAFSTHDFALIPPGVARPVAGIRFGTRSESRTLPGSQYGSTHVNEKYVGAVVDEVTAGQGKLHRIERGLCHFQDIYVLARSLNRGFSELAILHDPVGHLDLWEESGGRVRLAGWAVDFNPGGVIKEIAVVSGDRTLATAAPDHDRADVAEHFNYPGATRSGWQCGFSRDRLRSDDVFEINATNHVGNRVVIACDYPRLIRRRCALRG